MKIKKVKHTKEDGTLRSFLGTAAFICLIGSGVLIYNGDFSYGFLTLFVSGVLFGIVDKIPQKNVWKD